MPDAEPASILDASALIALLQRGRLRRGPRRDRQNSSRQHRQLGRGALESRSRRRRSAGGRGGLRGDAHSRTPTETDCIEIALLRPLTKASGLSLADRACLALAKRLDIPALTADRDWADLNLGIAVQLIR